MSVVLITGGESLSFFSTVCHWYNEVSQRNVAPIDTHVHFLVLKYDLDYTFLRFRRFDYIELASKLAEAIALMMCIKEVASSNLSQNTNHSDWVLPGSP
jgi:hypothetical protein